LVVGQNPGSKLQRAQELGVRILTEEEFAAMVAPFLGEGQGTDDKGRTEEQPTLLGN
jgi:DNA ligase (NAD+)